MKFIDGVIVGYLAVYTWTLFGARRQRRERERLKWN